MWFPTKRRVARRVEELISEYSTLLERTKYYYGFFQEMISGGLGISESSIWVAKAVDGQTDALEFLREAAVCLSFDNCDWRELLPMISLTERAAKMSRLNLSDLDKAFAFHEKLSAERMRRWGME